jgi:hypothetical protein
MPHILTADQILALAPDPGSAKAGQGLANPRKWLALGRSERAVWGECQGSAREPYRTQIDLNEPAFRCSCPSRKFPCKHGLGLFLLLASQPAAFEQKAAPAWVTEWLGKRDQSAQQRTAKQERPAPPPGEETSKKRTVAQARTAAARETKVAAGMAELGRWMRDLVRQGLAGAQSQPHSFWETVAARMVDAQAPGLARMVRELADVAATGEGWQERLLDRLTRLQLLIEGYQRLEALPPETQADIRAAIGWSPRQEELLGFVGVRDRWLILGQRVEDEDNLRVQRTWLWGDKTDQPALVLGFAAPGQPLDRSLAPGTAIDAELVFFPGAYPLRALVKQRHAAPQPLDHLPGYADLTTAIQGYGAALTRVPWLERFPMPLQAITPARTSTGWAVLDADHRSLPLAPTFRHTWRLMALSGGQPLGLFGEWTGDLLLPLSVYTEDGYSSLRAER